MSDVDKVTSSIDEKKVAEIWTPWVKDPHLRRDTLNRILAGEDLGDISVSLGMSSRGLRSYAYKWNPKDPPHKVLIAILETRERYDREHPPQPPSENFKKAVADLTPRLTGFAVSLVGDQIHADDLVSETVLTAYKNHDQYEVGTSLSGWLFKILLNEVRHEHRKKRARDRLSSEVTRRLYNSDTNPDSPERVLLSKEVLRALQVLPAEQREALLLSSVSGLEENEIAELQGVSGATVRTRIHRARIKMREEIKEVPRQKITKEERTDLTHALEQLLVPASGRTEISAQEMDDLRTLMADILFSDK